MSVRFTFTPNPVTGDDPFNIEQVMASFGGIFGSGSDDPVIGVEDDGTPYALTARDGGFDAVKIDNPAGYEGQQFRRLTGRVTVIHEFES